MNLITATTKSSFDRKAKRLHDPTLSDRAFAIFFLVTLLIAITLLLAPKAGAGGERRENTGAQSNRNAVTTAIFARTVN